ncbi:hypothetical protein Tco_0799220 [Tanacetum coccineum]
MDDPLNEFLIKDSTSQGLSSNEETERRDGAGNLLRFKIDKKKRFKLTLEVFRDIFQICLRVPDRKFDPIPSEEDTIYGVVLPECLTSPEMKESKEYKTYSWPCIPDEVPVTKGKRVKISVKKSSTKPATGIVIREPLVEAKSKGKEKKKVDVAHGKGIELLSEITPTVTSEGTGDKPGVPDVTEDDSIESGSESWELKSDEDKGMDDNYQSQFDDDVVARLETQLRMGKEFQEQVVDDAHVTITTVTKKNEVLVTSSSRSSDLASKFLNFLDIPQTDCMRIVFSLVFIPP